MTDKAKQYPDSAEDALRRITVALIKYREQTTIAYPLIVEVKERELWKLKYSSFKEFCETGIGFSERWAYALLSAAKVAELVQSKSAKNKEILATLTPKQAEKLEGLKPTQKAVVFDKAVEIAGGEIPTPKQIEQAKSEFAKPIQPAMVNVSRNGKPLEEAVQTDRVGQVIPPKVIELWNRAEELSIRMTAASATLKTEFKKAQDEGDILFAEHSANEFFGVMMKVKWACKDLRGYAICTECQGRTPDRCTFCKGRGFISKFRWGQTSDLKRAVILKAVAERKK